MVLLHFAPWLVQKTHQTNSKPFPITFSSASVIYLCFNFEPFELLMIYSLVLMGRYDFFGFGTYSHKFQKYNRITLA